MKPEWKSNFWLGANQYTKIKQKVKGEGQNNPEHKYFFIENDSSNIITSCNEEKDLGVTFDNKLNFDKHINNIKNKSNKILGLIRRNFKFLSKDMFVKLYKALVRPHLEYGQSVWSPYLQRQIDAVERVQRRATKLVPNIANLPYEDRLSFK